MYICSVVCIEVQTPTKTFIVKLKSIKNELDKMIKGDMICLCFKVVSTVIL